MLITQFFPPETNAAANRVESLADALSENYQVSVVALKPSYPSPDLFTGTDEAILGKSYPIYREFSFTPHYRGLLKRAILELVMCTRLALLSAKVARSDYIIVSIPSMFLLPVGLLLAKMRRSYLVVDVRDLTWKYIEESLAPSRVRRVLATVLGKWMLVCLRAADTVVTATEGITGTLAGCGVSQERLVTVQNGVSSDFLSSFELQPISESGRRPIVAFVGLMGYNQGLWVLREAVRLLPEVDFLFVGDGPEREDLQASMVAEGLCNFAFTGYLDRVGVMDVYRRADILFASIKDTPTLRATSLPAKLLEYMSTWKPIVFSGRGIAGDLLTNLRCAVVVPPDDAHAVATAIRDLLSEPSRMTEIAERAGRFAASNLPRPMIAGRLVKAIETHYAKAKRK
jgi:glycosyltransferase involved in cell wall biosynthesis